MAQVLTLLTSAALVAYLVWKIADRIRDPHRSIQITLRLDRPTPGAHLIWHIHNCTAEPIRLEKLVAHGPQGLIDLDARVLPKVVAADDDAMVFTDVHSPLLPARTIAVRDAEGHEHTASRRQLLAIQDQLRVLINRRATTASAPDFLSGAADLAFGVVILGLGFFMLMWVIATS